MRFSLKNRQFSPLNHQKYLLPLSSILLLGLAMADDLPLGQGDPSYDTKTGILSLPVLTVGSGNFFNVQVKLDKFTIAAPGLSNQCPLQGIRDGYPLNYTCATDYATSLAILQGTWRSNSARTGLAEVTFNGNGISGKLAKYMNAVTTADSNGNKSLSVKPFTNCTFSGQQADDRPLYYQIGYKVAEIICTEGKVDFNSSVLPGGFISTFVFAEGGKNKIDKLVINFVLEFYDTTLNDQQLRVFTR